MAATTSTLIFSSSNPTHSTMDYQLKLLKPMTPLLFLFLFFTFTLLSLCVFIFSLYRRLRKAEQQSIKRPLSNVVHKTEKPHESNLTQPTHSLLLEILTSNSPKWATLFSTEVGDDPITNGSGMDGERLDSGGEECGRKKKKKRGKKKRSDSPVSKPADGLKGGLGTKDKQDLVCLYPFTSSSSVTQRKIKQQYDQLVKSHQSNGLTLVQVGQFVNCLIEARNELQHKSDVIRRKFTITKALLIKADRSSFDRLRQQIYKLELDQKRLEEDAFVYNLLQQQLKLSPAYNKMLEIGACMELEDKSGELVEEDNNTEFSEISFEELLAQEKKDSYWQKNGKPRSCLG